MLLHLLPLTLHLPTSGPSTRRQHLQTSAAALAVLPPLAAHADKCETDGAACELVIPQQELLGGLASAPVRHVIVTGASSGVGLAGAKLLTAAGHQVTLACRTQAKADAAAAACMEFAASSAATGPAGKPDFYTGRRAGGVATGAACDLSSLASVRRSRHRLHCQRVPVRFGSTTTTTPSCTRCARSPRPERASRSTRWCSTRGSASTWATRPSNSRRRASS